MQRLRNSVRFLNQQSNRLMGLILSALLIPGLLLAGYGFYAVLIDGYIFAFLLAWLGVTVVVAGLVMLADARRRKVLSQQADLFSLPESAELPGYWTARDRRVYAAVLPKLPALLKAHQEWRNLHPAVLEIFRATAQHYGKQEWSLTATELLTVIEKISGRYRSILKKHVPGIEQIQISWLIWADRQWDRMGPLKKAYAVYRKARMVTPDGILAEVRSLLFDKAFGGVSDELQDKLTYLLLDDVLRTSIDLYGEHFRFDDEDLTESKGARVDRKRIAPDPEPIRIGLLGQTGAGKSALVNALLDGWKAEVSPVPSTDRASVYQSRLSDDTCLHILDLPGLSRDQGNNNAVLKEVVECDLVLWLLRSNQQARDIDVVFKRQLDDWIDKHPARNPPMIIGILSQADRLLPRHLILPQEQSSYPDNPDTAIIGQALEYNRGLVKLEDMLAIAVPPDQPAWNLDQLKALLQERLNQAINIQLGRRRQERTGFSLSRELPRLWKSAKAGAGLIGKAGGAGYKG